MIALPLMIALAMPENETSKIYMNGHISSRFEQKVSKNFPIEISNNKSNFIAILFHSYPGPFSITPYDKEGEFTKTFFINNEDSFSYAYLFKPIDKMITIEANEDEIMSFSLFSSSVGCEKDEDYFITSKPNQTLVFKNDAEKDSYLKINSKSSKCVLIDSGGTMELTLNLDENRIETHLNQAQIDSYLSGAYSKPLFYTFVIGNLDTNDQISISYTSNHAYDHTFQTGDPIEKVGDKNKGVIRIDITVAIISGLFLVFILLTIIGLRRMRRLADMPSEDEGQTNEQLSVYDPESNENSMVIEKVQYPRKFSSEEEYSLSGESENNVKEETYYPPKDVFNIAKKCSTELLEESDVNEMEEDQSSNSWDEENPYNHDAATTL